MGIVSDVTGMISSPIVDTVNTKELFLVTGIVIVCSMLWLFILYHIRSAAEEIV